MAHVLLLREECSQSVAGSGCKLPGTLTALVHGVSAEGVDQSVSPEPLADHPAGKTEQLLDRWRELAAGAASRRRWLAALGILD